MSKRNLLLLVLLISVLLAVVPAFAADSDVQAPAKAPANDIYIVQMIGDPVGAYEGEVAGLPATRPQAGANIDLNSPAVNGYTNHLRQQQNDVAASVGARKLYSYVYAFNGFAAEMSAADAAKLRQNPNVVAVTKNEMVTVDTSSTPDFLGLTAKKGLWAKLGGVRPGLGLPRPGPGENIVIGIIDSGIWPEQPSFTDRNAANKFMYAPLAGWSPACETGEQFTAANCNRKLITARYFNEAWGGDAGIDALRPWEFNSPRDYNGHGTHTASTAGGNYGVMPTGPATVFGPISGIAPRARIAAYKALWSTVDASTASGQTADLVAAIDQAVADGVDVINYSISGTQTNFADPVEISFFFAADAGVFVAASAGNSGPTASTVAHPSPWITTVAAGTHNRSVSGSVTLGNNVTYYGASIASGVGPAPLINSDVAGLPGASATMVNLCYSAGDNGGVPVLDPAVVTGKIVVCERGVTARVNKSLAVQQAGGVGMILVNPAAQSLNADFHVIPTVHLQNTDKAAVEAYAATPGATATINPASFNYSTPAPYTASFSSRGPLTAGAGDLLKPDLIAPGQDILAAVAPPGAGGLEFNLLSGTSMSSPHVAGLGALMMDLYPTWSPTRIKSALMTTGYDVLDGANSNPLVIFSQGAGHVRPNSAMDPGLVFDSNANDWLAFLCGTTTAVGASTCAALSGAGYSLDPSDMNVASIAIGDLPGSQTVKRTVTNVSNRATYHVSVSGLSGINVTVTPSTFTLAKNASQTIEITFSNASAPLNAYVGGQITWSNAKHDVRVPVVIRPVAFSAPAQVTGTGGPINYPVKFGYTGAFTATPRGLVAATTESRTVLDDPTDGACSLTAPNAQLHSVVVPAGTTYARFSLFDAYTDGDDDLDLCVYRGATSVGSSGTGTSAEEVNLVNPTAATYTVVVHGWGTDGPDANYTLFYWLLDSTAAGNMSVTAPAAAVISTVGTINLTFSGLAPATKYLGSVAYGGTTGLPNPTIVRVDTP
ncbi:MAG: S8 family serine peptidase [Candidatus Promineofilum sp.]|nr:S8 family serine peptidase [Promineifilum sp.]